MKKVEVVPYDPEWPHLFEVESARIKKVLGDNCFEIHHIGSTAVLGLAAKPIIDMIPVVRDIRLVDQANERMEQLGYEVRGENGILFRRFFSKNSDHLKEKFHLHIFEEGASDIERHLKFRDWINSHPEDKKAYAALKKELAVRYPEDIFNYVCGKDAFVAAIDSKTGFRGTRITKALKTREWERVHALRKEYFFNQGLTKDPEINFDAPDHFHYMFYKESEIIGYLHLELLEESQAILKMMIIDPLYRKQGLGKKFLIDIERWLQWKGVKKILVSSHEEAYPFYLKQGYQEFCQGQPKGRVGHYTAPLVKIF